ncbi:hypothetical protein QBL07_024145 (plasmid) [Gordonia rubripertincta]|uniref:Major facilitator superfamily (MFS) profile domain-containing protein n=2 Tax=Gordonia rubripertincta TaxID=36822 RepID=A0AAW6REA0_GORRU|nr:MULTISPECIES: hypothetical protein [Gordonia]MDG6783107.1 hypothetical protein [Gordonia rubripertincta]NKY65392.1 hypothetical protein [Gordonia rubripertincta]GAB86860.1 hypothetical protein GORBP_083_00100 [Gordonia rubripertincta NBRC 101908]
MTSVLGLTLYPIPRALCTTLTVSACLGLLGGVFNQAALWAGNGPLGLIIGLIGMGAVTVGFIGAAVASMIDRHGHPAPRWSSTGIALLSAPALVAAGIGLAVIGWTGLTLTALVLSICALTVSFYAVPAERTAAGSERA